VALQELVFGAGGVEQAAVVAGDAQAGIALVHAVKEGQQGVIMGRGVEGVAEGQGFVQPLGGPLGQAGQALLVVAGVVHGQQVPRLGIEQKEELVEQAEGGGIDLVQTLPALLLDAELSAAVGHKAASDLGDYLFKDQLLQLVADLAGVGGRTLVDALHKGAALGVAAKGVAPEKEPPAAEPVQLGVAGLGIVGQGIEDQAQVHLIELAGGAAHLTAVEPPDAAIGQDAPGDPRAHQVADHLVAGVAAHLPGIAPADVLLAQGAAPILGLGDGCRPAVEGIVLAQKPLGFGLDLVVQKESVIGPGDPAPAPSLGLDGVVPAQSLEQRFDEFFFGLGFVPEVTVAVGLAPQVADRFECRTGVLGPLWMVGQAGFQIMAGEQGFGLHLVPLQVSAAASIRHPGLYHHRAGWARAAGPTPARAIRTMKVAATPGPLGRTMLPSWKRRCWTC